MTVKLSGNVISNGGSEILERGFYWSTIPNSHINGNKEISNIGVGEFDYTVSNLTPNTVYYTKAFAENAFGISYGEEKSFNTALNQTIPSLATYNVENIETTSAIFNGELISNGNAEIIEKGFCWGINPNPTIDDSKIIADNNQLGIYNSAVNDLSRDTKYYVRSYATNSIGTAYGEEIEFSTLNNYFMFNTNTIITTLHNTQDKVIYFLTINLENSEKKIIAYNYVTMDVIAESSVEYYQNSLHTIGTFNNQMELYIITTNKVKILNALTLEEVEELNVPDATNVLSSVQMKNNLIFVSYYNSNLGFNKVATFNRSNLTYVSEFDNTPNSGAIIVYNNNVDNNIKSMVFPRLSNSQIFSELTFNLSGTNLSHNYGNYEGGSDLIRTNDNASFVIKGKEGRIYPKNDLMNNSQTLSDGSTLSDLTDYCISPDGNNIYTIREHYGGDPFSVKKYNTIDFNIDEMIFINESANNIFIDNNQLIIIDYAKFSNENDVYISFYDI
ncbi:hypothetical protein [Tenacibaculum aestuarii]|uniref:hypothetical protein n=1 Tax=Tenacibaculum aestuarii TaxID=362781 RepID=UPI0038963710